MLQLGGIEPNKAPGTSTNASRALMSDYPYNFIHSTPRKPSARSGSDSEEEEDSDEEGSFRYPSPELDYAEYSTRLGEILGDEGVDEEDDADDDGGEGFLYLGEDVPSAPGYREQLANVLGDSFDLTQEEDEFEYPIPNLGEVRP